MATRGGRRRAAKGIQVTVQTRPTQLQAAVTTEAKTRPQPRVVRHRFWLVQRLEPAYPQRGSVGFDRLFYVDYMGNSEFEYGKTNQSLKRIRAEGEVVIAPAEMTHQGATKTVYFVGPTEGMEDKLADFQVWLSKSYLRAAEWTNFSELFTGKSLFGSISHIRTNAWWSLEDDLAWALDEETAQLLVKAFAPPE